MLILAKSILGLMLAFFISVVLGWLLIPLLKRLNCKQKISSFTAFRHASKDGTPTMGGIIFILPTLIAMILLSILHKMKNSLIKKLHGRWLKISIQVSSHLTKRFFRY